MFAGIAQSVIALLRRNNTWHGDQNFIGAAQRNGNSLVDISEFQNSIAANGYQVLPSGLIVQWGSVNQTSGSTATFTFPIAFPNNVFAGALLVGTTPSYLQTLTQIQMAGRIASGNIGLVRFLAVGN